MHGLEAEAKSVRVHNFVNVYLNNFLPYGWMVSHKSWSFNQVPKPYFQYFQPNIGVSELNIGQPNKILIELDALHFLS